MLKKYDIVTLGEILIDFTPDGTDEGGYARFLRNPGGAVLNVAAVFAKYGAKPALIGKVGNDLFGRYLRQYLTELGIDCSGIAVDDDYNTTLAFVSLDAEGNRDFAFYRKHEADLRLSADELNRELLRNTRIFHFGSLSMTMEPARTATREAIRIARESGAKISYDPNFRDSLWAGQDAASYMREVLPSVDYLKVSEEEGEMITGIGDPQACADALVASGGPVFAAVTLGKKGSCFATAYGARGYVPAFPAKTIDTTGAGDTFFGTFLHEVSVHSLDLRDGEATRRAVELATKAAALSTERKGGAPSIPDYGRLT